MKNIIFFAFVFSQILVGCGGGGGGASASSKSITAADYALPSALPSVPDQSGK